MKAIVKRLRRFNQEVSRNPELYFVYTGMLVALAFVSAQALVTISRVCGS